MKSKKLKTCTLEEAQAAIRAVGLDKDAARDYILGARREEAAAAAKRAAEQKALRDAEARLSALRASTAASAAADAKTPRYDEKSGEPLNPAAAAAAAIADAEDGGRALALAIAAEESRAPRRGGSKKRKVTYKNRIKKARLSLKKSKKKASKRRKITYKNIKQLGRKKSKKSLKKRR